MILCGGMNDQKLVGGVKSRSHYYAEASKHFSTVLETLVDLCQNAKQESVRVSAASKLLDKILPNLASQSLDDGKGNIVPVSLLSGITLHVSDNNSHKETSPTQETN